MNTLLEIKEKYGKDAVITGEVVFHELGFRENYIGDELVFAFLPKKNKRNLSKKFRILRIKDADKYQKVKGMKILDVCVVFAYLCKRNYPLTTLLDFYYDLVEHGYTSEQIFRYCNIHTYRKYPIFRSISDGFKIPEEMSLWVEMFNRKFRMPQVNKSIFLSKKEKCFFVEDSGDKCFKPNFYWERERIVLEYRDDAPKEEEWYLRKADEWNFYGSRGITFIVATKDNLEYALSQVELLLKKRRGWKRKK